MAKIPPSVGRKIHYWPTPDDMVNHPAGFSDDPDEPVLPPQRAMLVADLDKPCSGEIAFHGADDLLTIAVFDHAGLLHQRSMVPIADTPKQPGTCSWMEYQLGQAQKTEAAEQAAGSAVVAG
jgi:hypothetical protein